MVVSTTHAFIQNGQIAYSAQRDQMFQRYQGAVERASFLNEEEKKNWKLLAYFMSENELIEAEQAIINEDLRRMQTRQQLRSLKIKR